MSDVGAQLFNVWTDCPVTRAAVQEPRWPDKTDDPSERLRRHLILGHWQHAHDPLLLPLLVSSPGRWWGRALSACAGALDSAAAQRIHPDYCGFSIHPNHIKALERARERIEYASLAGYEVADLRAALDALTTHGVPPWEPAPAREV